MGMEKGVSTTLTLSENPLIHIHTCHLPSRESTKLQKEIMASDSFLVDWSGLKTLNLLGIGAGSSPFLPKAIAAHSQAGHQK